MGKDPKFDPRTGREINPLTDRPARLNPNKKKKRRGRNSQHQQDRVGRSYEAPSRFLQDETADQKTFLSDDEIVLMKLWEENGAPEGDPDSAAPLPERPNLELEGADKVLEFLDPGPPEAASAQRCWKLDPGNSAYNIGFVHGSQEVKIATALRD